MPGVHVLSLLHCTVSVCYCQSIDELVEERGGIGEHMDSGVVFVCGFGLIWGLGTRALESINWACLCFRRQTVPSRLVFLDIDGGVELGLHVKWK